jgi:hypothetical protein
MFVRKLLLKFLDEQNIANIIIDFLGNECEKCGELQEEPLTNIINIVKGNYNFDDLPNSKYEIKKVCDICTYNRCSKCPIYVEIPDIK